MTPTRYYEKPFIEQKCSGSALAYCGHRNEAHRIIRRPRDRYSLDEAEHVDIGRLEELAFHRA